MSTANSWTADQAIEHFRLMPHPEGGYFREVYRSAEQAGDRSLATTILYLLRSDQQSVWHRVDATEMWHFYAGAPLLLRLLTNTHQIDDVVLGTDFAQGQTPLAIVNPHQWQAARSLGDFTLVGCTVTPGFTFSGFELARPGHQLAFSGELPPV